MNKPAAQEPTMDEILSSIRQIIADDDASPAAPSAAANAEDDDDLPSFDEFVSEIDSAGASDDDDDESGEALELSEDQIITEDATEMEVEEAALVVPDDISFEPTEDDDAMGEIEPVSVARAAPMPDPDLSSDLANHLVNSTAQAAASHAFSKLGSLALGGQNVTIEAMIREMLRPMLKEWLDENLPSVVERLVEKEIERIARGGR